MGSFFRCIAQPLWLHRYAWRDGSIPPRLVRPTSGDLQTRAISISQVHAQARTTPRTRTEIKLSFDLDCSIESDAAELRQTYNHHITQRALGGISPVDALKKWQTEMSDLFKKRVYK